MSADRDVQRLTFNVEFLTNSVGPLCCSSRLSRLSSKIPKMLTLKPVVWIRACADSFLAAIAVHGELDIAAEEG